VKPVLLLILAAPPAAETPAQPQHVRQIDLIHFSHTDYGFTDHPAVCRDMQRRYLDIALDGALATRDAPEDARFRWTAETTIAVNDWWQAASPPRREQFLAAVRAGQLEVTALPLNNTPFLGRQQWQTMTHWLPDELWDELRPQTAVQNDVNGFPRAGAMALLDRGVRYLFSGINSDSGGPPFARPAAFWWKMPDGRRLFVWLSLTYGEGSSSSGHGMAAARCWQPTGVSSAGRRHPGCGRNLAARRWRCLRRWTSWNKAIASVNMSMTNMWRYDNDPPFPPLAGFVATGTAWPGAGRGW
jgi:membrane-associated phospholipid phosphatase